MARIEHKQVIKPNIVSYFEEKLISAQDYASIDDLFLIPGDLYVARAKDIDPDIAPNIGFSSGLSKMDIGPKSVIPRSADCIVSNIEHLVKKNKLSMNEKNQIEIYISKEGNVLKVSCARVNKNGYLIASEPNSYTLPKIGMDYQTAIDIMFDNLKLAIKKTKQRLSQPIEKAAIPAWVNAYDDY